MIALLRSMTRAAALTLVLAASGSLLAAPADAAEKLRVGKAVPEAFSFVPLDIGLHLCVKPEYFRSDVKAAVLDVLASGVRPDGTLGFFHPDRFTFGTSVYLSAIVAAAQGVQGVESVTPTTFQRQRDAATSALDTGVLEMGRLEIARLDDDPSFPEHGVLVLTAGGGK